MTYLVFFLLFLVPFVVSPFTILSFEPPKVFLAEVLIEILLIWYLVRGEFFKGILKIDKKILLLMAALFILSLFGLAINFDSFYGNIFRLQGIFLFWHLLAFATFSSKIDFKQINPYLFYLPLSLLFVSTILLGVNGAGRSIGTLGEPNALAATAICFYPFLMFLTKNKYVRGLWVVLAASILYLSQSQSATIAFLIQNLFLGAFWGLKWPLLRLTSILLIMIVLSLSLPILQGGGWFENRSEIWQTALYSGVEKPLLGHGFNVTDALRETSIRLGNNVQYQVIDSSHNFLLDYFVQMGSLGLAASLVLIFFSIKNLIDQKKALELVALLGIIVVMLFNPVSVVTLLFFWYLIGRSSILS